tara:strand:- start:202 stop:825 length:624 start_codon:yes stop_codon:yes gene_type:complete
MTKILMLVVALVTVGSVEAEAQQDLDELVRQGDTYMKRGFIRRNNLTPYTGEVVRYAEASCYSRNRSDDGKCTDWFVAPKSVIDVRGNLRNGKWHGPYENFSDDSKGRYAMEKKCGEWMEYHDRTMVEAIALWVSETSDLELPDGRVFPITDPERARTMKENPAVLARFARALEREFGERWRQVIPARYFMGGGMRAVTHPSCPPFD